jgi:cytidylate kinase
MAIITISRGSFAGGTAVARALAEQLGYPCLGREDALALAAQDYGIVEDELRKSLNESPRFWEEVPGKRLAYVKCLTAVLLDQARDGDLVYHGNVGHLLVGDIAHVLRVRVVADIEYRIQAAIKQAGLSRDKAVAYIRQVDESRSRWARLLYNVDCQDSTQYHLTLNLGQISVASAVGVIVQLSQREEFRPTDQSLRQYENIHLASRVWAALAKNPTTRSAGIHVTANDGNVVITGSVHSTQSLELIPQIASQVEGVQSVQCEAGMGTDWYW